MNLFFDFHILTYIGDTGLIACYTRPDPSGRTIIDFYVCIASYSCILRMGNSELNTNGPARLCIC